MLKLLGVFFNIKDHTVISVKVSISKSQNAEIFTEFKNYDYIIERFNVFACLFVPFLLEIKSEIKAGKDVPVFQRYLNAFR